MPKLTKSPSTKVFQNSSMCLEEDRVDNASNKRGYDGNQAYES
jgi:hypothetical protein